MQIPSDALAALERATQRSKRTSTVRFPVNYVRRGDAKQPTASRLLRSGELRLKLHMTLIMQATKYPYTLPKRPTRSLSTMLDLPAATGTRRITDALQKLRQEQLLVDRAGPDGKAGLLLLHPDGSGSQWDGKDARYIGVPLGLWTNGWILKLSGRALAVELALLEVNGGTKEPNGELMDGYRKRQYGLSDDTWTRATHELETLGLLQSTNVVWGNDDHEIRRRKRYLVLPDALSTKPEWISD
jgi:hypothetical protein